MPRPTNTRQYMLALVALSKNVIVHDVLITSLLSIVRILSSNVDKL